MSTSLALRLAALLGVTAIAAGTFGAHGLQGRVDPTLLPTFETGVRYHAYHALALLALAALRPRLGRAATWAGWLFFLGSVVFAGSLYALVLSGQRLFGAVTPFGGVMLLAGWGCLLGVAVRPEAGAVAPPPPS